MQYSRMPIEAESPEEIGYANIRYNLAESSVRDRVLGDLGINLNDVLLCYGEHRGDTQLRKAIIADSSVLNPNHVLVCPSAATALFVVATTLLQASDHLVVLRPNYATNIETPRTIGCQVSTIDLSFENGYSFDIEQIKQAIRSNTKLISLTQPHNPTGRVFDETLIQEIITLAETEGIRILIDETYRDLNFQSAIRPYWAEYSPNVVSVCSLSKAFGTPGIRIGWIIGQNTALLEQFLAAKEQIIITNSVVDEAIALHLLQQQQVLLPPVHAQIRENFAYLKQWFASQKYLEWVEPQAGVVCFPRVRKEYQLNTQQFYGDLLNKYQTLVGVGHWFEQPDTYFRLGFGYPTFEELREGLGALGKCLRENLKAIV